MRPIDQGVLFGGSLMFFIGIDWAEKHLDYCIENNSSDVIKRGRVDNDDDGFNSMLSTLGKEKIQLSQIAVAIESPHQHVVDFLLAHGVSVYPVNPTAIHDYRKSRKPSGSKSDEGDAQLIASYLREHHKTLRVWRLPEAKLRQLKLLVSDRDKVVREKVRLQNQLRSTLLYYFPQAVDAFADITCPTSLNFLSQFPTFEATAAKTDEDWQLFLDEQRVFNPKARQSFLAALKRKPIAVDEVIVKAKVLLTQTIVSQLQQIIAALKEYDKRITELLLEFSDGNLFRSLPGVDVILAAKLLVAIGTDRERFSSADELQSYFGTAPYTKSSGQYRGVHFRFACHKGMRAALGQMAFASLRNSAWAKSYYTRKRNEGKKVYHALRCLANSWLKVIFAIWKNQTDYDETKHLASVARHQLNQVGVVT
jgi:transposase